MSKKIAFVDNTLTHHGVKGMKWGVRKRLDDWRDRRAGRKAGKLHIKMVNPYSIRGVYKRLEYGEAANKIVDAHKGNDAFLEGYRDSAAKRFIIYHRGVKLPKKDPLARKESQDALEKAVQYYTKDFKQRVQDIEEIRAGTYKPKPGDYGYKNHV